MKKTEIVFQPFEYTLDVEPARNDIDVEHIFGRRKACYLSNGPHFLLVYQRNNPLGMLEEHEY